MDDYKIATIYQVSYGLKSVKLVSLYDILYMISHVGLGPPDEMGYYNSFKETWSLFVIAVDDLLKGECAG